MWKIFIVVVGIVCFLQTNNFLIVNGLQKQQLLNQYEIYKSPFRYIIFDNEVKDSDLPKDAYRDIGVLIEEKAFSEETLRKLFEMLSRKFPEPRAMRIDVYTSLEQVPTPEEAEIGAISDIPDDPNLDKYHRAIFMRQDGNELFRYTINPPDTYMKTIILKGKDPQERRK